MTETLFTPIDTSAVTRAAVAAETSLPHLSRWRADLRDTEDELVTMITAIRDIPGYDGNRLGRRLGYARIAINWINKRIRELGGEADCETQDEAHIRELKRQITIKEEVIAKHKLRIAELEGRLTVAGQYVVRTGVFGV